MQQDVEQRIEMQNPEMRAGWRQGNSVLQAPEKIRHGSKSFNQASADRDGALARRRLVVGACRRAAVPEVNPKDCTDSRINVPYLL